MPSPATWDRRAVFSFFSRNSDNQKRRCEPPHSKRLRLFHAFRTGLLVSLFIPLILALAGCSSTYNDLKQQYSEEQYSAYYYDEISRVDDILPREDDRFLTDMQTRLFGNGSVGRVRALCVAVV